MANNFFQGQYAPTNPDKYVGTYPIRWRSSWEHKVMMMLDRNPNIISWASESIKIPYLNPFTNKHTVYIPDFIVCYNDANGVKHTEIIEVKPKKESCVSEAKTQRARAALALNSHKWAAAQTFAHQHGMAFRVLTEDNIFHNPGQRK